MKIKRIKYSGEKQFLYFDDNIIISTPEYYEFEVGMELELNFDGIMFDINKEIINMFSLSNDEYNFNLYVNDNSNYKDEANLLSTFIKLKELPEISPVHFLKRKLEEDDNYRESWKANIAMAFKDYYDKDKSLHENANVSADKFLTQLCKYK